MSLFKLLLKIVLLTTPVIAEAAWYISDKHAPDTQWQKAKNGFGASLILTPNSTEMYNSWNQKPTPTYKPKVITTNSASRGQMISAAIFINGCKSDKYNNCQVTTDYVVINPDGTVYADIKDLEVWLNKTAPKDYAIQISVNTLDFKIEETDQIGSYIIKAIVKDNVSNTVLSLVQNLQVSKTNEQ